MKIERIEAREVLDARGTPTIACTLVLQDGRTVSAQVASGQSVGEYEAREARDADRYDGKGVLKAIEHIQDIIAPSLIGQTPCVVSMDLKMMELDGTPDKAHIGGNAMLAVSKVVCRAQALIQNMQVYELLAYLCDFETVSLPFAMFNLINGGAHAHTDVSVQEFLLMPVGVTSFRASMEAMSDIFNTCEQVLEEKKILVGIGDEGGYAAHLQTTEQVLDIMMEVLDRTDLHDEMVIALDVAANELYNKKTGLYHLDGNVFDTDELIAYYQRLVEHYPIYSIEDGLEASNWKAWQQLNNALGSEIQIVGDDLFATNPARIIYGLEQQAANAAIIKPNQVGTVTETLQAIKLCKEHDMNVIVSHRSGDTCDDFIADLAVGTSAGQMKAGGLMRGERVAKYNRLLAIEDELMMNMLE